MSNRIVQMRVAEKRLNPVEALVEVVVQLDHAAPHAELRGRILGPRCQYANTIELAYPLRPHPGEPSSANGQTFVFRTAIPEPSLWDPVSPHLYEVRLELWHEGVRTAVASQSHGLRSFGIGSSGLLCNGRPLAVQATRQLPGSEREVRQLHDAGYNLLLVPLEESHASVWTLADRFGFLVLGCLTGEGDLRIAGALCGHTACLGWIVPHALYGESLCGAFRSSPMWQERRQLLGVEQSGDDTEGVPVEVQLLVKEPDRAGTPGRLDVITRLTVSKG